MRIYHGSDHIVMRPAFGEGNSHNDFGPGFYCSVNPDAAAEWATERSRNGFVSVYAFEPEALRVLDISSPRYNAMHWLRLLLDFREFDSLSSAVRRSAEYIRRNFYVDYQMADVIIGYPADSCLFTFAQDFLNDRLSYHQLRDLLAEFAPRKQYVLKSRRAFDRLKYVGYEPVRSSAYYPATVSREIRLMKSAYSSKDGSNMCISRMIDEDIQSYDMRL